MYVCMYSSSLDRFNRFCQTVVPNDRTVFKDWTNEGDISAMQVGWQKDQRV